MNQRTTCLIGMKLHKHDYTFCLDALQLTTISTKKNSFLSSPPKCVVVTRLKSKLNSGRKENFVPIKIQNVKEL